MENKEKQYLICKVVGESEVKECERHLAIEIGDNKIESFTLDNLIEEEEVKTEEILGKPYTIVNTKLKNGYILHVGTSCVDPKNYSETIGSEKCKEVTRDTMWKGLGFALALAQFKK